MKYIYLILLQGFLFAFCNHTQAQCTWATVGPGATSTTSLTSYQDLIMAPGDIPYVSYCDASLSNAPVVKTFTAGAWNSVGSLTTFINSSYTSMAYSGSTPYVAFSDGTNGGRAYVKSYSGGVWSNVGAAVSTGTTSHLSLAAYNGTLYIAYVDGASANRAVVKSYTAGAWNTVGAIVSTGTASFTSLSIDNSGTPYLIYQDVANSSLATVKKYTGSWVAVGTGTVSTGAVSETRIDVSYNNIPYIAYLTAANICTIKTFTAGTWQPLGTGTVSSVYQAINLAVDAAGTPYLGYYELGGYKTSVSKYNGSAWVYAGNNYFSINSPSYHGMAITSSGTPYIAIADANAGNYVKKLATGSAITLQPLSTTVCATTPTLMTVATNTTGVTYQWQVGIGGIYANVVNGPTYSGVTTQTLNFLNPNGTLNGNLYRCVINDGCTNLITNSATLTVNSGPAIAASNATVCAGAVATVTVTNLSGVTYLWNTGATTYSIAVTPTITTVYTATATNSFGCSSVRTSTVTTIASKTIGGNVSSSAGPVSGNMILYRYSPVLSKWDSVAFTPFGLGYAFGAVDSSWYVVKAVPTATNVLVTYGTSAVSWKGATTITHGCSLNSTHNVSIIPLSNIGTGTGSLSGRIMEGQGFGQRPGSALAPLAPGQPIGGIVVKGGKNPGGSMFAQTTTGADGTYTLSALPNGDYFILVDIPGLDTNGTYHPVISISNGQTQYTGLDFVVDSAKINPVPFVVGVDQLDAIGHELSVFPNPAKQSITIRYKLQQNASVNIEVLDLLGRSLETVLNNVTQLPGDYAIPLNTADLRPGIYFININMNGARNTVKLVITD